jgi:hypothetical protein
MGDCTGSRGGSASRELDGVGRDGSEMSAIDTGMTFVQSTPLLPV